MLSFPCNVVFDEECKAHLKMFKLSKDKNESKALTLYEYRIMLRRKKKQYYKMQEKMKTQMFDLQPKLA